jgi:acyl-CoA thioester hydrolase
LGPILSETYVKFKFPVSYPDKIIVGAKIEEGDLNSNGYKLTHSMWSLRHNRIVADGFGTVVSYNYATKKVEDMPIIMLNALKQLSEENSLHLEEILKNDEDYHNE